MTSVLTEKRNKWFISKVKELEAAGMSQADIARALSVVPQYLTPILSGKRNASERFILKFCEKFNINPNDLYVEIGLPVGLMTESEMDVHDKEVAAGKWQVVTDRPSVAHKSDKGIPLIPLDAVAGFGINNGSQVMEYEYETYVIPSFKGAEFLIQVKGSSMYPKYASGDIVACKKLPLDTFFQWNKVYVVDSEQGVLIKRIKQGSDRDHIMLVSENTKYDPFELHRQDITSLAIVIGVIRLE